jgi:hypothetical protein
MRSKTLLFLVATLFITAAAQAQTGAQYQGASSGPVQFTTNNSNAQPSSDSGSDSSTPDGDWCAPLPPLEISTESVSAPSPASSSPYAYGTNDGVSAESAVMAATPGPYAAPNLRLGGTAISLGQIARNLRQTKSQATQGPLVISQDSAGKLQVCDAGGANCRHPQ